jgi:hypothetical protein
MGTPSEGTAGDDQPAEYTVVAKTAGVLTVAVQGSGDLVIQVIDPDGQTLPEGSIDRDVGGQEGTELGSVTLPEAGTYRVRVRTRSPKSTFQIAGSLLSFPPFQTVGGGDPDRRPSTAKAVQVGRAFEDTLDPTAGDLWDWFVFKITEPGTLTVLTRASGTGEAPDLILEIYAGDDYATPTARSDQDLQGSSANETVSISVTAGQSILVKVSNNFTNRKAAYRLSSSLAP